MNAKTRKPYASAKRIADTDFVDAYTKCGFNHAKTIAALGISRTAYYSAMRERDELAAAMATARRQIADVAEDALLAILADPAHKEHSKVAMFMATAHDRNKYGAQAKIDVSAEVKFDAMPLLQSIAAKYGVGDEPINTTAVKVIEDDLDFLK